MCFTRGGTVDLVVASALGAVSLYLLRDVRRRSSACAGLLAEARLVARDEAAPVRLSHQVDEGEPARSLAGAVQQRAIVGVEDHWDHPRVDVVSTPVAEAVDPHHLGHAVGVM